MDRVSLCLEVCHNLTFRCELREYVQFTYQTRVLD